MQVHEVAISPRRILEVSEQKAQDKHAACQRRNITINQQLGLVIHNEMQRVLNLTPR